jgi:hypothetical protein
MAHTTYFTYYNRKQRNIKKTPLKMLNVTQNVDNKKVKNKIKTRFKKRENVHRQDNTINGGGARYILYIQIVSIV